MKKSFLFHLFFVFILCSCSTNSHEEKNGVLSEIKSVRQFWISSGLSVDEDKAKSNGAGIEILVHSGKFLFARNDFRVNGIRSHQLFSGNTENLLWKELKLPGGDIPGGIFADSSGLYVGSFYSRDGGRLWFFDPKKESWHLIPMPVLSKRYPITDSSYGIDGIAKFNGRLVVSFSRSVNWENESDLDSIYNPIYFQQIDGSWKNYNKGFPSAESFMRAVEWNGMLYAMTYGKGIFRFDFKTFAWHKIKEPDLICSNGTWNERSSLSRDALPYKGELLVGYANLEGVFSLSPAGMWSQKTECSLIYENENEKEAFNLQSSTPVSVYKFIRRGNNFIALGEGSAVYSGAKDRWISLPPVSCVREIFDGVLVDDFLYVAAYQKGVLKMPVSYIDSLLQSTSEVK